jgi:hypothetical protein
VNIASPNDANTNSPEKEFYSHGTDGVLAVEENNNKL